MFKSFSQKHLDRIRQVWGSGRVWGGTDIQHWLQHPLVQQRINLKVSGSPQKNRFEYFLDRYLQDKLPVDRALTLGCGIGELERGLCQYGFARSHEGVDLSDQSVRLATEKTATENFSHLRYRTADLNSITLERAAYDVVFGISSVHHTQNLEHLFQEVQQALKPGGYFFLDEFIGPSRFQWTDTQIRVINEQLQRIPEDFRRFVSDRGKIKRAVHRKSVAEIVAADPSEAVRSAEIVPLLGRYFRILEIKGCGGALLHELLYDIAGNFCDENAGSLDHLRWLFDVEDELTNSAALSDDFAVIIATIDTKNS